MKIVKLLKFIQKEVKIKEKLKSYGLIKRLTVDDVSNPLSNIMFGAKTIFLQQNAI